LTNVSRLPGPSAEVWDWQRYGACRGHDSGEFFHPDGERGASRIRREIAAKSICRRCPVRPECAAHALAAREPYGVWGGFTEAERLRLLATGWEDAAKVRGGVDVNRLEARLGLAPAAQRTPVSSRLPGGADGAGGAGSAHLDRDPVIAGRSVRDR
jgi:WhiB family redox-sensing transcriptional regulator